MKEGRIPFGTLCYYGEPSAKPDKQFVSALAAGLAHIEGIAEAHLPLFYAPGFAPIPELILVLGLGEGAVKEDVIAQAAAVYRGIVGVDQNMMAFFYDASDPKIKLVRSANMRLDLPRWSVDS